MMTESEIDSPKAAALREMYVHLGEIRDRCDNLITFRDAFTLCNNIQGLRSLVGQLDAAGRRYLQAR